METPKFHAQIRENIEKNQPSFPLKLYWPFTSNDWKCEKNEVHWTGNVRCRFLSSALIGMWNNGSCNKHFVHAMATEEQLLQRMMPEMGLGVLKKGL